ncbi:MAG: flippase activity-associated protein Agl23 [Pontiella sp.]
MKWIMPIAFVLVLLAGLSLRVPKLADRPLHHDEANQAYRLGMLLEEGTYQYDADDHHGPTLYYLTLPIAQLTGVKTFAASTESTYRMLPVIFGMGLILLLPLLRHGLGGVAILAAALFTAISPAMAYYSRFYIQEILLVAFTLLAIASGWRSIRNGSRCWAILCGIALGLMFATKETAVLTFAAMGGSLVLCALWAKVQHFPFKNMGLALLFAGGVSFILFSSFFTHMDGPLESILALRGYVARGSGVETDHVQPWNYFLRMLTIYRFDGGPRWSEGLVFGLGLMGCISIVWKKIPSNCDLGLARFLMFYTLLLTVAYSVLSYKTPWCILSFLHGWILLAGIGVASLLRYGAERMILWRRTILVRVALLAGLAYPVYATYRLAERTVFRYAADYRNPYVYAHTTPDFKNLIQRIQELEAVHPAGNSMYIQVIAPPDSTWPLPFYLRNFTNIGYWTDAEKVPKNMKPAILITPPDFEIDPEAYLPEYYGLRPDTLLAIHIERSLWDAFIESRK